MPEPPRCPDCRQKHWPEQFCPARKSPPADEEAEAEAAGLAAEAAYEATRFDKPRLD